MKKFLFMMCAILAIHATTAFSLPVFNHSVIAYNNLGQIITAPLLVEVNITINDGLVVFTENFLAPSVLAPDPFGLVLIPVGTGANSGNLNLVQMKSNTQIVIKIRQVGTLTWMTAVAAPLSYEYNRTHASVVGFGPIIEFDPVWTAAEPQYGNLNQNETISGNWVNTANPWVDNEVANALTIDGGSVTNSTVTPGTGHVTADYFVGSGSSTNAVDLGTAEVSGTLPVNKGGSGATTLTGVLKGNGTSAFTAGQVVLTSEVSGVLPIANGGTNSGTALSGQSIMISNGTAIVQGPAGTTTTVLHGNAAGAPTYGAVSLVNDITGTLAIGNGGTGQTTANAAFNALAPSQGGNAGKYLTTDGTNTSWANEVDGVIGNEVTDAANLTLTRSGTGTSGSPYKLAVNLGNANNWSAIQTFSAGINTTGTFALDGIQGGLNKIMIGQGTGNTPIWTSITNLMYDLTAGAGLTGTTYDGSAASTFAVDHDATLKMDVAGDNGKLGINLDNANTWTATQTFPTTLAQGNALISSINSGTAEGINGGIVNIDNTMKVTANELGINTSGATSGQVLTFNGTTTTWVTPSYSCTPIYAELRVLYNSGGASNMWAKVCLNKPGLLLPVEKLQIMLPVILQPVL